jgi:hypothetical protein
LEASGRKKTGKREFLPPKVLAPRVPKEAQGKLCQGISSLLELFLSEGDWQETLYEFLERRGLWDYFADKL